MKDSFSLFFKIMFETNNAIEHCQFSRAKRGSLEVVYIFSDLEQIT